LLPFTPFPLSSHRLLPSFSRPKMYQKKSKLLPLRGNKSQNAKRTVAKWSSPAVTPPPARLEDLTFWFVKGAYRAGSQATRAPDVLVLSGMRVNWHLKVSTVNSPQPCVLGLGLDINGLHITLIVVTDRCRARRRLRPFLE
jgi:hypothetical protein